MGQVISLNFGLVHQPAEFDYDFEFDDLPDDIKSQLPEDTAEILQLFSEEDLHFLRWRICWQRMARAKQLPPEEFLNMQKNIWLIRSGRGFGKTLTGANWMGARLEAVKTALVNSARVETFLIEYLDICRLRLF